MIGEYSKDKAQFEQDIAEAKASGKPHRLEVHLSDGRRVLYLTEAEIADAQARTAAEAARPKPPSAGMIAVEQIKTDPAALATLKAELAKP